MADKKKSKSEKTPKMVPAKKLPKLFKKEYTESDFEKNVLKKLFIDADREFISLIFEKSKGKNGESVLKVNLEKSIKKADLVRCKKIASEINAQKGGIKLIPLFAALVFVAVLAVFSLVFKNKLVSYAVRSSMQKIFLAKTDIAKVDLKILGASLEIQGLEQADKDSPMKNLFSIDKIAVDFNLNDLLKGKIHSENLEVTGVALGTERKVSGELPAFAKKSSSSKEEKKILETSTANSLEAAKKLQGMFADYNPETMLDGLKNELKSPAVAEKISGQVQAKVEKWQKVPDEYQKSVQSFSKNVDSLVKTDWSKMSDPVQIKAAIDTINSAINEGNSLKEKLGKSVEEIKSDSAEVNACSKELNVAVKADNALVEAKINAMKKSFTPAGLNEIMNDAVRSIMYSVSGKYYPYVDKAVTAAMSSKNSGKKDSGHAKAAKTEKKQKVKKAGKPGHKRAAGRDIYYRKDMVPKLLIEKVSASGYEYKTDRLLFKGTAAEISSDQNIRGKPASANAEFNIGGNPNSVSVVVDTRADSDASLIAAEYSGSGWPLSADAEIFKLNSNASVKARLSADEIGSFTARGTLDLKVKDIEGMKFEPARVSELYGKALKKIDRLIVGFKVSYSLADGLGIELTDTDRIASQLSAPVTKALSAELSAIADGAKKDVAKVLSENTGAAQRKIARFADISSALNKHMGSVNQMEAQLEKKKKEAENKLKNGAKDAAADAAKKALKSLF